MTRINGIVTVLGVLMVLSLQVSGQQEPQFTQFMFNKLVLNPAYAGSEEALSLTAINRNQWTSIENAPVTQSLSAHALLHQRVGLGLAVVNDRVGIHRFTKALAIYSYHIKVGKRSFASMGLQGGIMNFRSSYQSLNVSANDPRLMNNVRGTDIDIGAGVYFRSPRLDAGISMPGLLSRRVNISDTISVRFRNADAIAFMCYRLPFNKNFTVESGLLIKYFPALLPSFDINPNLIYKGVITVGVSYRANESIDAIMKLQLTHKLQVGYAYDYPVKNAALLRGQSHELMVHYVFRKTTRNVSAPR